MHRPYVAYLFTAGLLAMTGCAHYNLEPTIVQQIRPLGAGETVTRDGMRWEDAADVEVFYVDQSLPSGVQFASGKLEVKDISRIEVIAFVTTKMFNPFGGWRFTLAGPYMQDESWKDYWCPPNMILATATIGLWVWLPFSWPCFPYEFSYESSIEARKARLVNTLKKGAKALGGNTIIISEFAKRGDSASIGNGGGPLDRKGQWGIEAGQAYGYVLLVKR